MCINTLPMEPGGPFLQPYSLWQRMGDPHHQWIPRIQNPVHRLLGRSIVAGESEGGRWGDHHPPLQQFRGAYSVTYPSHEWSMALSFMSNPLSAHTTITDSVKKPTVDRSLASDRDSRTYSDLSCPQMNPLYPQVGNVCVAIRYN